MPTKTKTRRHTQRQYWDAEVSVPEAATILGVSPRTLSRLLDAGLIPWTRPSQHRRVKRQDVLTYRQQHSGGSPVVLDYVGPDDPLR